MMLLWLAISQVEIIRSVLSPPPVFPLARSAHSYENGTISRLAQAAEVESLLSPIRRRAAKRTAPEPSEESEAFPNVEVERAESEGTLSASNASLPEWTGIVPPSEDLASHLQFTSPLSGETNRVDNRANEEEALNLLLTDPFMEKEVGVLPAIITLSLEHESNERAVKEMTSMSAGNA